MSHFASVSIPLMENPRCLSHQTRSAVMLETTTKEIRAVPEPGPGRARVCGTRRVLGEAGGGGDGTGSARPLPRAATREIPPSPEGRERRCLIPKLSSFILGRMGKEPLSPKLRL